ncbi:uncharacterized protein [Diadema antillarum]|uniref:uncharacterized protein n=1 Tax=Diadema antillarum TaxID=105358 RepID=UPI003A85614A
MFVSDHKEAASGYKLSITFITPDVKLVSGTPQTIYSAGQVTDTSRQFLVARWRIEAPEGTVIHMRFKQFNLMLGIENFVIGDGLRPHNRRAYRFELTGSELPGDLVSVSNRMWIVFAAYTEGLNGTYEVEMTPIPKPGNLAPTFVGRDNSVILTSLYYPGDYPNNFARFWTVETSEQYRIRLKLLDFEMPNDNDRVYVYNGIWYLEGGANIAVWSGTRDIAVDELTTTVNGISIFLSTDPTDGRRGFKVELSAFTPPVVLTEGEVHELTSPFYPMPYKNNAYIEWAVSVPQGFGILLHFLAFDLIGEGDVLFVRKGENSTGPQTTVQLFTGRDVPLDVIVWERALWIQFSSDEAEIGQGFRLELRPILGEGHCLIPLGMEAGWIPDSSITATSQKDEDHAPNQARLHGPASWIPHPDEENPIIVVNFAVPHYVTGILIQGGLNSRGTWLTSVTISFEDETEEIRQGSWDPRKVSPLFFSRPRLTSVINIKPSSKTIELVSLRFEILGCENASSIPVQYLGNGTSYEDLLKIQPLERYPRHGWTPAAENTHPWIELRFDGVLVLRAIIFQQCLGSRLDRFNITTDSNESLSLDLFSCDTAMCKVLVPVGLESSTYRIHPTEWTGSTPCLRVTLLGCISVDCMTTYCTHDCSSEYLVPDIVRTKLETNTRTLPPRALCQRTITASPDNFVTIFLGRLSAIADITGTYDGSIVLSEPEEDRVTTFDPNGIPHIFISTSSRLLVSIYSGLYTLSTNITATYGSVDKPECSHASDAEQGIIPSCTKARGIMMSPNYIETYPNNIDWSWQITTRSWTRAKFSFIELDVLSLDSECNEDFVEVIDTSIDRPIGRYCSLHWPVEEVMSSLNWMTVRFHSDSIAGGSGFLGEYESVELRPDVLDKTTKETGESCPSGWDHFLHSCYRLSSLTHSVTWNEAELLSQDDEGGHLVSIRDNDEMTFLHYMISTQWQSSATRTYIGLGHRNLRGVFRWNDGTPMSYTDWFLSNNGAYGSDNQPDGGTLEACTMLVFDAATATDLSTALWHDVACASPETNQFVCEIPATRAYGDDKDSKMGVVDKLAFEIPCPRGLYQCMSGECISEVFVCDGFDDCADSSDESLCPDECGPSQYQCMDGSCISMTFLCDTKAHCRDNSDETGCVYPACREDEFPCVSGECIDLSKRCDFIDDCFDSSDESECDLMHSTNAFQCYNGFLHPVEIHCDGMIDCIGNTKEDEESCAYNEDDYSCDPTTQITCKNGACAPLQSHCRYELDEYGLHIGCRDVSHLQSCGNFTCPNFMIKCPSSYCIPLRYWCDGVLDCPYGEDEDQCARFVCPPGSYRCHGYTTCITQDEVCDEVIHCPEKDDELFCDLQNTGLSEIVSESFVDNGNILHLNLSGNNISRLAQGSLRGLQRLTKLNLHGNPLDDVSPGTFYNLSNLQELDVRETSIRLTTSGLDLFHGLQSLKVIHADRYVFCCLSGLTDADGCKAPRDQFSSCEDLMSNNILRVFIWILGASAFAGNGFVVFYRMFKSRRDSRTSVQSSFITNLAISDFLMGLYMITIAAADAYFRGNYAIHAEAWQSSIVCKVAGMVSVVSSEASVCLIMMISVDRCIHVVAPFKRGLHLTVRRARLIEFTIWSLALLVSILPVVIPAYIEGNFYGQSGVCLALPLTVNRPAGWHYSISLFIGANFVGFLITLLCYIAIYISIKLTKQQIVKRGKGSKVNAHLAEEIKLASKMALIVGTDLICWMPIIIMGLMSAAGKLVISAQVYAWTAVFILPVNSSLNPYLYTLSSLHGTRKSNTSMSTIFQESTPSLITPFDPMPNPKPLRMRDWISNNERDLTYGEQQVISRDIASAVESMKEAGFPASRFLQLPEDAIAVQTTESGRIEHAFLVLDSPFLCNDNEGDDHLHKPCEEVGNRAHVMRVMQRVKTLYTNDL